MSVTNLSVGSFVVPSRLVETRVVSPLIESTITAPITSVPPKRPIVLSSTGIIQ